jgi:hypothetical protein
LEARSQKIAEHGDLARHLTAVRNNVSAEDITIHSCFGSPCPCSPKLLGGFGEALGGLAQEAQHPQIVVSPSTQA